MLMVKIFFTKKCELVCIITLCLILLHVLSLRCWSEVDEQFNIMITEPKKLNLVVDKSTVIRSTTPIKRVSMGFPLIADVKVLSPRQVYIVGRFIGVTRLIFWGIDDEVSTVFDIDIVLDIARLKENLHEIFPEEDNIQVTYANNNITLSGTVSSPANIAKVIEIAESYLYSKSIEIKTKAPTTTTEKDTWGDGKDIFHSKEEEVKTKLGYNPPKVINLLEVEGVQQVMLEVRIAEMSKSLVRRLGFNFSYISSSGRNIGVGLLNNLTGIGGVFPNSFFGLTGLPEGASGVSDKINAIFRFLGNDTLWTVFIDALKEEGLVKVLAEPTLITLSGQPANFLAGGEFPVPVPQEQDTITIEWKTFGVGLSFTPIVLNDKKISMKIAPEVSDLDFSNAVILEGFTVPAIVTRRVSTTIELADGQSFAIAGLIRDDVREIVDKYPLLGDIPILGAMFRSTEFQKNETELLVIVTPHLVKPLDMANQPLPTDYFIEPDDFEWYLLGRMEGREKAVPQENIEYDKEGGLEGEFGHIVPR